MPQNDVGSAVRQPGSPGSLAPRQQATHVFERAGLGKAPFRVRGVDRRVGPIQLRDGCTVGAPGQPMGSCKFCGQSIAECWLIESADGKQFDVGCDCVRKTGDAGLRKQAEPHLAKLRKAASARKFDRDRARYLAAFERLDARQDVADALAQQPAPAGTNSLLGWLRFVQQNGGMASRLRAARIIESAIGQAVAS